MISRNDNDFYIIKNTEQKYKCRLDYFPGVRPTIKIVVSSGKKYSKDLVHIDIFLKLSLPG